MIITRNKSVGTVGPQWERSEFQKEFDRVFKQQADLHAEFLKCVNTLESRVKTIVDELAANAVKKATSELPVSLSREIESLRKDLQELANDHDRLSDTLKKKFHI
jgi:predicted  nucleic acid-binding Zn-ribbon protein